MKKFNITMKFVQSEDPRDFAAAIDEKTKGIYVESIGNPKNTVAPLPELAKVCLGHVPSTGASVLISRQVAHDHGIPLLVDNTFGMGGMWLALFGLT